MNFALTLLILAAAAAPTTDVAADDDAPLAGGTIVFACDFEAPCDTNYDGWPDDWTRRRGAGYPQYLQIGIVPHDEQQTPGPHQLRMELDGGAAQVNSPFLEVSPQHEYVVEARLKTERLKHNVAGITLTFYDAQRKPVGSVSSNEYRDVADWQRVRLGPFVPAVGEFRFAVISLHLRPTELADLQGTALFDDIRLLRLPRVHLRTNNPHHVFSTGDDISITCKVTGVDGEPPSIELQARDVDGQIVDELTRTANEAFTWQPRITQNGFYQVRACIHADTRLERERQLSLAVVSPHVPRPTGEFGWSLAAGRSPLPLRQLAELVEHAGIHWLKYSVVPEVDDPERAAQLGWFAERLFQDRVQLVGVLDPPHPTSAKNPRDRGPRQIGTLFTDADGWRAAIDPSLTRLALHVRWWQLGRDDDTSFLGLPQLADRLREVRQHLHEFNSNMRLGIAWPWLREPPAAGPVPPWDFLALTDDPPFTPLELAAHLSAGSPPRGQCWVTLRPLPQDTYSAPDRTLDLVTRMIAAKRHGASAIFLPEPFDERLGVMHADGTPAELFLPWRTTATLLAGTEYLGSICLPNGSSNQIFARSGHVVMVVWNERPTTERLFLGDDVQCIDVWGRTQPSPAHDNAGWTEQEITIGPLPLFVTGLDPLVARWRLALQVESSRLQVALGRSQTVAVRLRNPTSLAVDGTLRLRVPATWHLENGTRRLQLSAGQTFAETFPLQLGTNANSGQQPVRFDFDVTTDRNYKFSVYDTLHVGLGDVEVKLNSHRDDRGDLVVEQTLINHSDRPVNFYCILFVPNRGREWKTIRNLGPGQTTNTFVLRNGDELAGQTLWLRAEEVGGDRVLNTDTVVSP